MLQLRSGVGVRGKLHKGERPKRDMGDLKKIKADVRAPLYNVALRGTVVFVFLAACQQRLL